MKFVIILIVILCTLGRSFAQAATFSDIPDIERTSHPRRRLNDCEGRYVEIAKNTEYLFGVNGIETIAKEFAHMAAIGWTLENGTVEYGCGGSLISEDFVLTAAHCTSSASRSADVVRVGDINLYADSDDEHAQHFQILEIIKHPGYKHSSHYFDIALLKLDKSVTVNSFVCPACLFTNDKIEYEQMVATGWGDTGFGQKKSEKLLKFLLGPIPLEKCRESYPANLYLMQGLLDHQFCAFDTKMDTCSGDSGGPLGVKLATNHRLVPFVVGITSFGSACGKGSPGVYTKVASFIPWIQSVVGMSFDPHDCALRNIEKREVLPNSSLISLNGKRKIEHHVYIGSSLSKGEVDWFCSGSLISDDYVVTAASCLGNEKQPNIVELGNNILAQRIEIKRMIKHPEYNSNGTAHNVALIQLKENIDRGNGIHPSCVWTNNTIPDYFTSGTALGTGPQHLHNYKSGSISEDDLNVLLKFDESDECKNNTNEENELCAGIKDYYLVPEICNLKNGSVLESRVMKNDHLYNYLFGIYSHGKDCGFGKPAVFLRLSAYVQWMESVIFEESLLDNTTPSLITPPSISVNANEKIIFRDSDKDDSDKCVSKNGAAGSCVKMFHCQLDRSNRAAMANIVFCNPTAPRDQWLICCPTELQRI